MAKERLDVMLFEQGLAASREKARNLIRAGSVFVDNRCITKAGAMFEPGAAVEVRGPVMKYVSRGGYKLEKAIEKHGIVLKDCVCMDVGASTGGFTDCMLQNGAAHVMAVDVGSNQLDATLREDSRVTSMEQTNIRNVTPHDVGRQVDFVSVDVSFISLSKVLGPIRSIMKEGALIVCLIKPQFEAGKERIGKKGVVRDAKVHREVISEVLSFAAGTGFEVLALDYSPIRGPEGNIEYLACLRKKSSNSSGEAVSEEYGRAVFGTGELKATDDLAQVIERIVSEAHTAI